MIAGKGIWVATYALYLIDVVLVSRLMAGYSMHFHCGKGPAHDVRDLNSLAKLAYALLQSPVVFTTAILIFSARPLPDLLTRWFGDASPDRMGVQPVAQTLRASFVRLAIFFILVLVTPLILFNSPKLVWNEINELLSLTAIWKVLQEPLSLCAIALATVVLYLLRVKIQRIGSWMMWAAVLFAQCYLLPQYSQGYSGTICYTPSDDLLAPWELTATLLAVMVLSIGMIISLRRLRRCPW